MTKPDSRKYFFKQRAKASGTKETKKSGIYCPVMDLYTKDGERLCGPIISITFTKSKVTFQIDAVVPGLKLAKVQPFNAVGHPIFLAYELKASDVEIKQ